MDIRETEASHPLLARTTAALCARHHWFSAALLLACLFPLLWIAQYNYPSGDDFIIFMKAEQLGTLGSTIDWYFGWTGRYSAFLVLSAVGSLTNWLLAYKVIPVFLLVGGFCSSAYFVHALLGEALAPRMLFSLSACFYVLLLSVVPDITTLFYWASSNIMYCAGVFASVLAVGVCIRVGREASRSKRLRLTFILVLLTAAVAGFNEISLLATLAVLGYVSAVRLLNRKPLSVREVTVLALALTFGCFSLFAPGNAIRAARVAGGTDVVSATLGSIALAVYLFVELFSTTILLPASILYLAFLEANKPRVQAAVSRQVVAPWVVFLLLVGTTALMTIPVFATVGITGLVDRLKNVYVLTLVHGWLFFLTVFAAYMWRSGRSLRTPGWVLGALSALVAMHLATGSQLEISRRNVIPSARGIEFAFSLLETRSVFANAYLDMLSGRAARFAACNATREELLKDGKGDSVELPLYSFVPKTIFVQDLDHRWGAPREMTEALSRRARNVRYLETGPPPPPKERF